MHDASDSSTGLIPNYWQLATVGFHYLLQIATLLLTLVRPFRLPTTVALLTCVIIGTDAAASASRQQFRPAQVPRCVLIRLTNSQLIFGCSDPTGHQEVNGGAGLPGRMLRRAISAVGERGDEATASSGRTSELGRVSNVGCVREWPRPSPGNRGSPEATTLIPPRTG